MWRRGVRQVVARQVAARWAPVREGRRLLSEAPGAASAVASEGAAAASTLAASVVATRPPEWKPKEPEIVGVDSVVIPPSTVPDGKIRLEMHTYIHAGRKLPVPEASHLGENKVKMSVHLLDLDLNRMAQKRLVYILGPRFNEATSQVVLTCERFPSRVENRRYLYYTLERLKLAAQEPDPEFDSYFDVETGRYARPTPAVMRARFEKSETVRLAARDERRAKLGKQSREDQTKASNMGDFER